MKRMHMAAAGAGLGMAAAAFAGTPTFTRVGVTNSLTTDISADGSTIVGVSAAGGVFRWQAVGGYEFLGGGSSTGNAGISADGSVITGTVNVNGSEFAGRWLGGTEWESLGGLGYQCDAGVSSGWGVSADGSTVVGLGWVPNCRAHGIKWTQAGGMVDLGSLIAGHSSRANGVNADGSVIVGWDESETGFWRGAVWRNGVESLIDPSGGAGAAQSCNSDGSIIVGTGHPEQGDGAWMWSEVRGLVNLGNLDTVFNGRATAAGVSDNGAIVVGFSSFGISRDAFVWTARTGIKKLDTWLVELGCNDAAGWDLGTATCISPDGRYIAGWGFNPNFGREGWVIDLGFEPTCPSDFDGDGFISGIDFDLFVQAFESGDMAADFDLDGFLTGVDFDLYVEAFEGGC